VLEQPVRAASSARLQHTPPAHASSTRLQHTPRRSWVTAAPHPHPHPQGAPAALPLVDGPRARAAHGPVRA
jgi:hypothetical protein